MKHLKKLISISLAVLFVISLSACNNSKINTTKEPFPNFEGVDFEGNKIDNKMFGEYEATIVNFWSNGCGSCIEEMPELEQYYQDLKKENINLVSVPVSAGESDESKDFAQNILKEKGVTFKSIISPIDSEFYTKFIGNLSGYPTTYIVDKEGNIVGAPLVGVVKNQEDKLMKRLDEITK